MWRGRQTLGKQVREQKEEKEGRRKAFIEGIVKKDEVVQAVFN
jgi:hypothetical protein